MKALKYSALLGISLAVVGCETVEQLRANLATWSRPRLDADRIATLAACVPALPTTVLDPALWPRT